MIDIAAARADVQKAVAFLATRLPADSDVFGHLTRALAHLKDKSQASEPKPARRRARRKR